MPEAYERRKYIVYGAFVISKNDGDEHFVSARDVAELYRVDPEECLFLNNQLPQEMKEREAERLAKETGMRILCPRYDGDYNL